MANHGANLYCLLHFPVVDLSWSFVLNPSIPIHEEQVQEYMPVFGFGYVGFEYMHDPQKHTVIYNITPAEQTAVPWSGENKSPLSLLQTKGTNVQVLLLLFGTQAIRHSTEKEKAKWCGNTDLAM